MTVMTGVPAGEGADSVSKDSVPAAGRTQARIEALFGGRLPSAACESAEAPPVASPALSHR
jgi:hypothetical protein